LENAVILLSVIGTFAFAFAGVCVWAGFSIGAEAARARGILEQYGIRDRPDVRLS
jgi:hypothetical protein